MRELGCLVLTPVTFLWTIRLWCLEDSMQVLLRIPLQVEGLVIMRLFGVRMWRLCAAPLSSMLVHLMGMILLLSNV